MLKDLKEILLNDKFMVTLAVTALGILCFYKPLDATGEKVVGMVLSGLFSFVGGYYSRRKTPPFREGM